MGGFENIMVLLRSSPQQADVHWTSAFRLVQIPINVKNPNTPEGVFGFLAEMEGFEPPHALRRLADFESAPFSHLGTSPGPGYYISGREKNQGFSESEQGFFASSRTALI